MADNEQLSPETVEIYENRIKQLEAEKAELTKKNAELFVSLTSKESKKPEEEPKYKTISDAEILAASRKGK